MAAQVVKHLQAGVARLYGWSPDEAEEGSAGGGQLVLLAAEQRRPLPAAGTDPAGAVAAAAAADLPGTAHRVSPDGGPASPSAPHVASLLQQAVHSKSAAVYSCPSNASPRIPTANGNGNGAATTNGSHGPGPPGAASSPPDCAAEHAASGATAFAALPLTGGERLLGVLWVAWAPPPGGKAAAPPASLLLPSASLLRQVSGCVSMCLAGAVDPDYAAWLAGSLRRLAAAATLQALVGELCEAVAQHLRRRFLVDAVASAAVVPEPSRSTVGFMLDHRPAPGGPAGVARWAAAASRQASMTCPPGASAAYAASVAAAANGGGGGGGGGGGLAGGAPASGLSLRRSDSFTNSIVGAPSPGSRQQRPGGPGVGPSGTPNTRFTPSQSRRTATLAEQAALRAAGGGGGGAAGGGGGGAAGSPASGPGGAASGHGVVPSLRAKGFQLSHTLLQRMVSAAEGRGPDGVFGGLAVADCARHVQDVHQPSRDVCMLMAGGVRGADMTADASDSNMFASERSTGRIAVQSLVLLGVDCGPVLQSPHASGGAGGGGGGGGGGADGGGGGGAVGGGAVLALYVAFPTRLPPMLVQSAHGSARQLLGVEPLIPADDPDADGDVDVSATHDEADVMLSSDPRVDEEEGEGGGEAADGEGSSGRRRRRSAADSFAGFTGPGGGGDPQPAPPAAVLTVTEADGTSSMRQHMGLLVESLMSTLRTAQMEDPTGEK
ncbi:hypothetical protein GPECTOR_31g298 [Gonium pectorale]|uniref:Uncharacterized protein n=1 Tax=Gonium pectorale TaxID=33097 RepID=A0A150GDM6_GONPE|nr:hypothetical protein GPECTOR_31g298 [Gonium pectorale]|eukprot:KXZ47936.1 hypothetical protein GPECTOR_31g298 [Gonium pectorale]